MAGWTITFEETLKNTNRMFLMIGVPPCQDYYPPTVLAAVRKNALFIASLVTLLYTTIGELLYLGQMFQSEVNFLEVTFQAPCIGYCTIGVLKMVILAVRRNTIAELVALFNAKWKRAIVSDVHRAVSEETMRPAITVTTVTAVVNIVMGIAFTMLPIAEMIYHHHHTGAWIRKLPFNIWWPFDPYGGSKFFWFVYPLYFVIGFTGIIIHMAFDCLFCILAAHLCMHFRILKLNIAQMVTSGEQERDDVNRARLYDAIVTHQDLMGCSVFMQNVFSVALFINFFGSSIIICIQAFMITTVTGYTLSKFVLFMLCFLIELLMLCAYGEDIVQSSGDIADATYNCLWYEENKSFRMSVSQIMLKSQEPMILTAWKIWPIQIKTFSSILQASWSYFTLLKTVYGEK